MHTWKTMSHVFEISSSWLDWSLWRHARTGIWRHTCTSLIWLQEWEPICQRICGKQTRRRHGTSCRALSMICVSRSMYTNTVDDDTKKENKNDSLKVKTFVKEIVHTTEGLPLPLLWPRGQPTNIDRTITGGWGLLNMWGWLGGHYIARRFKVMCTISYIIPNTSRFF